MVEEPDIIKQLREAEKIKGLKNDIHQPIESVNKTQQGSDDSEDNFFMNTRMIDEYSDEDLGFFKEESIYRSVFELSPDGIFIVDLKGIVHYCNVSAVNFTGRSKEEVIGKEFFQLFANCEHKKMKSYLDMVHVVLSGKFVDPLEIMLSKKDGKEFPAEIMLGLLEKNDKNSGIQVIVRDISSKKLQDNEIRKSEKELRDFFDNANDLIQSVDSNGFFKFVNKKWKEVMEYSDDDIKKLHFTDILREDYVSHCERIFNTLSQGESFTNIDVVFKTKSGEDVFVNGNINSYIVDGKLVSTRGIFRDMTEQKHAFEELKKSKKKLRESKQMLKEAQEIAKMGRWDYDHADNCLKWSNTIFKIFEIERTNFKESYESFLEFVHPDDKELVNNAWVTSLADKKPYGIEHRLLLKDGTVKWVSEQCQTEFDEKGKPVHTVGIVQDITKRKKAEEKLRESEQFLQTTFDSVQDGISVLDTDLDIMSVNKTMEKLYPEMLPLQGKKCYEVYQGRSEPCKLCPSLRALKTGKLERDDVPLIIEGKAVGFLEVYAFPILDDTGKATGVVEYVRDVTDRKQAEDALKEKNLFIEKIMSSLPNTVVYIFDLLTHKNVYASDNLANVLGYTAEEFQAMGEMVLKKLIHPDDLEPFIEYLKVLKTLNEDDVRTIAYRMKHRNGHWVWIENRDTVFTFDESGRPLQTIGSAADITKRKQAELALRRSEERYRNYFEQSYDAIMTLAPPSWNFTSGNPATIKMFGAKKADEFIGRGPWDLSPEYQPDGQLSSEKAKEMIETAMRKGSHFFEWVHTRLDGTEFQTTVLLSKMQTSEEEYLQAVVRDITELKQTERKLEEEQKRLEHILNITGTGINITDAECNLQYVDNGWQKIYGDPSGRKCYEYFMGLSEPCQGCGIPNALETKEVSVSEENLPKEGNRLVEVHTIPFQNSSGQWLVAEFNIDITDRKKIEDELRRQIGVSTLLSEVIRIGIETKDLSSYLKKTLDTILGRLDYDGGGVYLVDKNKRFASIACSKNIPEEFLKRSGSVSIDDNPVYTKLFKNNEMVLVENYADKFPEHAALSGFNSILSMPITVDGTAVGALNLARIGQGAIPKLDIDLIKSVTSQMGLIWKRIQFEEELKQNIDELKKWKKVTVGRELKMKELKKKIKELKERCQQ